MTIKQLTKVTWVSGNTPMIELRKSEVRFSLTKRELLDLQKEIGNFISYYETDFTESRIGYEDLPEDISFDMDCRIGR